jgi:hypothetical protein
MQMYKIIRKVKEWKPAADQRLFYGKRRIRNPIFIAYDATQVANDGHVTIRKLAETHGVSTKTIHTTLHEDLHLSKKSARWVPKLLNQEMKNERARICEAFLALLHCHSIAMLDRIVTMDESAVSFHIPQTKQQSKQWLEKRTPGLIKGKVQASRMKQMVLVFFDSKGLIYTNYVPTGPW